MRYQKFTRQTMTDFEWGYTFHGGEDDCKCEFELVLGRTGHSATLVSHADHMVKTWKDNEWVCKAIVKARSDAEWEEYIRSTNEKARIEEALRKEGL